MYNLSSEAGFFGELPGSASQRIDLAPDQVGESILLSE